jgi:uncharacterized membrane protein
MLVVVNWGYSCIHGVYYLTSRGNWTIRLFLGLNILMVLKLLQSDHFADQRGQGFFIIRFFESSNGRGPFDAKK